MWSGIEPLGDRLDRCLVRGYHASFREVLAIGPLKFLLLLGCHEQCGSAMSQSITRDSTELTMSCEVEPSVEGDRPTRPCWHKRPEPHGCRQRHGLFSQ